MKRRRLFAQLFPWFLFLTLAPPALVLAVAWKVVEDFHMDRTRAALLAHATMARDLLGEPLRREGAAAAFGLGRVSPGAEETRLTLIGPDGTVWGETHGDPERMDNHAARPEVEAALAGRPGESQRYSETLKRDIYYVAIPIPGESGAPLAVVRAALPLEAIRGVRLRAGLRILAVTLLTAFLAAGIGLYVTRLVTDPLEDMERVARRFGEGDLRARVPAPDSLEMNGLADALNRMADQLAARIGMESRQRREREAVLASMDEGVLAIDMDGRVIGLNAAAARLLGADEKSAAGRNVVEVARNPELERFVTLALGAEKAVEGDLVLHGPVERHVQMRGAPLSGAGDQRTGVVVVLNDVTRLRRLEMMRREFVSNVSHELRTPITAIRGFAETLEEDAADEPDAVRRFAGIIGAHARRLETLVQDMLTLSRLEHAAEREGLQFASTPVKGLLEAAVRACEARAEARGVRLETVCPDELEACVAPSLVEQALVNLADNAVKYSEDGGRVLLEAETEEDRLAIRVRDWGCGIERKHLPRLFERFYRVDHARSRKLGGTGLGLAIVKHIALAHGGEVTVESAPGEGSVFTLRLPRRMPPGGGSAPA